MSAALLDVNVLVALFDPAHPSHEEAHQWFGANRKRKWATCPITINGCVRVLSSPAYPTVSASPGEVIAGLETLCDSPYHEAWQDEVTLLDGTLFRPSWIGGLQKITDVYLLGLVVRKGGRLVTFDHSIPLKAVVGAESRHLQLLGGRAVQPVA